MVVIDRNTMCFSDPDTYFLTTEAHTTPSPIDTTPPPIDTAPPAIDTDMTDTTEAHTAAFALVSDELDQILKFVDMQLPEPQAGTTKEQNDTALDRCVTSRDFALERVCDISMSPPCPRQGQR